MNSFAYIVNLNTYFDKFSYINIFNKECKKIHMS